MFDSANRLEYAKDGFQTDPISGYIAKLGYDDNGNRDVLHYYPSGSLMGSTVDIGCTYNRDNYLTNYTTTGGPTFIFDADDSGDIDGLGRLISADETITQVGGSTVNHSYTYSYDMLSRLKYAYTSNVAPTAYREYDYEYDKAGNMTHSVFDNGGGFEHHTYYQLDGDQVTGTTGTAGNKYLTWDDNGRQTSRYGNSAGDYPIGYNWDGKAISSNEHVDPNMGIEVKYTPDGMRIWKKFKWNLASYEHKYIVDSVGDVPQVLLIIDANDVNGTILETLVHANGQVVMQYDGDHTASRYFYLHDRLGSVRAIIDSSAAIQNCYFYTPWGSVTGSETAENVDNWYAWAGYWYEDGMENGLSATYYCDARHYSSGRFLTRDPVRGKFSEPMTLHQYLYCMNDPINRIDPTGEFFGFLGSRWARGKNAAASITAEKWAEETIIGAASVWNGLTQGYLNVLFGPGDMSDKAKFWVGFVGGFGEMQVGMRTGSAALGATVASTFTSAANSALSESTEFISIGTAVNIGLSAAMGAFGDWAADGLDPFTLWAIGVDAAMAGGLGQMGYEYTYGD
jgi:RHS repeat-associated protein